MKELVAKHRAKIRLVLILLIISLILLGIYFILKKAGVISKFNNLAELKRIILGAGGLSYGLFALLQFLQVTLIPLPSSVTTLAGVIIFGPWRAFIVSLLSILLGSLVAYIFGRYFGRKILPWAVGKDRANEVENLMARGKVAFFLMMLFPFFPDDVLCIMAGVSHMNFKFFLITNLITRTIGLFTFCILGGNIFSFFYK